MKIVKMEETGYHGKIYYGADKIGAWVLDKEEGRLVADIEYKGEKQRFSCITVSGLKLVIKHHIQDCADSEKKQKPVDMTNIYETGLKTAYLEGQHDLLVELINPLKEKLAAVEKILNSK